MPAGSFRHVVTVESQATAVDAYGDPVDGEWGQLGTDPLWYTSMAPGAGGETDDGLKMVAREVTTFTGWYRADITTGMRLVLGGRTFNVTAVRSIKGQDMMTEVDCTETVVV